MADPFSIIASTIGIADVCVRLVNLLVSVKQGSKTIDDDLDKLIKEINSTSSTSETIHESFKRDIAAHSEPPDSGEEAIASLWHATGTTLESCRTTLEDLNTLLTDVIGDGGPKTSSMLDNLRKYFRKQSREDELLQLRQRLNKAHDVLQILLTAISITYTRKSQATSSQSFTQLSSTIQALGSKLQKQIASLKREDNGLETRTHNILATAKSVIPLASLNDHFMIPQSISSTFTGRRIDLENLKHSYMAPMPPEKTQQKRFVIYGLGGSGKTQFCCKFAQDNRQEFWGVFWIDASTTESARLSFADIAERAKIAPNERSVKHWLSTRKRPWLLLIDNANNDSVENFFPWCESGLVLLTTRNQSLRTQGTFGPGYYHFTGLGEQDSIELLLRSADEPTPLKIASVQLATDICKTLGYLPLAIVHAGKAILKGECTLQTFRTFFERGWARVRTSVRGKEHSDSFRTAPTPNEAVYSTFEILYPAASEDAIELLKLLSFMHRQQFRFKALVQAIFNPNREAEAERMEQHQRSTTEKLPVKSWRKTIQDLAIGLRLLLMRLSERPIVPNILRGVDGLERDEVEDRLRVALAELRCISLVDYNEIDGSCSMHPLVQWWARERMSLAEQAIWCQSACNVLAQAILIPPLDVEESDKELRRHMLPHIEHVRKQEADIREKFRLRQRERRRPWPILPRVIRGYEVRQLTKFALVYADHGLWGKVSELLLVVGEFVRQNLGVAHPLAVRALLLLSESYFWLSYEDKGISLQLEIHEACRALRGEEDILTLNVRDQLAISLANRGRFREARDYQEKVVEGFKIAGGADHADTLRAITHLGKIVAKFAEFDEAVKLHREALDGIQKDTRRHPFDSETLDVKQNLAMAILDRHRWGNPDIDELERAGQLEYAEQLVAEVIKQRESKLGKEHNSTLWAFCDLARIKAERGAVEEAEDIARTRLPIAERNLGESHIGTLMGKSHFGNILILRGKLSEAETILEQAVQSYEVNYKGHPDQVIAQGFLVQCYRRQGKDDKAVLMQGKVITGVRSFFGEGSPWELHFLKNFTF